MARHSKKEESDLLSVLNYYSSAFASFINVHVLLPVLVQKNVLTAKKSNFISQGTATEAKWILFALLKKLDEDVLWRFMDALKETASVEENHGKLHANLIAGLKSYRRETTSRTTSGRWYACSSCWLLS